ncbi:hypothetical protein IWQ56_004868, partial [Coemansia nantahalensis]
TSSSHASRATPSTRSPRTTLPPPTPSRTPPSSLRWWSGCASSTRSTPAATRSCASGSPCCASVPTCRTASASSARSLPLAAICPRPTWTSGSTSSSRPSSPAALATARSHSQPPRLARALSPC